LLQEISKKYLTTPRVCGKIIMLFLRQQVLERQRKAMPPAEKRA
jgi:hypothetical protein